MDEQLGEGAEAPAEGGRQTHVACSAASPLWVGSGSEALVSLPDDFRRTVASSILKWVVNHQNYCSKIKAKSKKEEAKNDDPSPKKGTHLWGRASGP